MRSTLCFKQPSGSQDDRPRDTEAAEYPDTCTTQKSTVCPWRRERTLHALRRNHLASTRSQPINTRQAVSPTATERRKREETPAAATTAVLQILRPLVTASRIINARLVGDITSRI